MCVWSLLEVDYGCVCVCLSQLPPDVSEPQQLLIFSSCWDDCFQVSDIFFSFLIVFFIYFFIFSPILVPPRPNRRIVCLRILQNRPGDRERERVGGLSEL